MWGRVKSVGRTIDPRRSLVAGVMSLIIMLAVTFSIAAAIWVGGIARQNVLEQHIRRLSLETDQLASDLTQTLTAHLGAVRAAAAMLRTSEAPGHPYGLRNVFDELVLAYPQFDWIAIADSTGLVVNATDRSQIGIHVDSSPWFDAGHREIWIGEIEDVPQFAKILPANTAPALGDIAMPVMDETGRAVGVIAARLSWRRTPNHPQRLTDEADSRDATQAYVLNRAGFVLIGPNENRNHRWNGTPFQGAKRIASMPALGADNAPQFERLPSGRLVLVSAHL